MTESEELWGLVEVMGHRRYAGLVTQDFIGGVPFVRIDIPAIEGVPEFTKLFGAAAIYSITLFTEAAARSLATTLRQTPTDLWDLPPEWIQRIKAPDVPATESEGAENNAS